MSAVAFAVFASLLLTESALLHPVHAQTIAPPPPMPKPAMETNCPPDCVRGTPEHDVWWCGFFNGKTQEDCESDTQIGCKWSDGMCVPEG